LTELSVTSVVCLILVLTVGILLVSGTNACQRAYASANKKIKQDAMATSIAFGSVGRKANRLGYIVYEVSGADLIPALPKTSRPQEVVWGDAVEFRYWDVPLDETDSHSVMDD